MFPFLCFSRFTCVEVVYCIPFSSPLLSCSSWLILTKNKYSLPFLLLIKIPSSDTSLIYWSSILVIPVQRQPSSHWWHLSTWFVQRVESSIHHSFRLNNAWWFCNFLCSTLPSSPSFVLCFIISQPQTLCDHSVFRPQGYCLPTCCVMLDTP